MPRIVALQGSPRKTGTLAQLVDAAVAGARQAGADVEIIHLYDLQLTPCTACMACRPTGACVRRDDDVALLEKAFQADGLIMASPTYWANMSGVMKLAVERLSGFLLEEPENSFPRPRLGKNRGRALLIATCSTPWPFSILANQCKATLSRLGEIAHWAGYKITGRMSLPGTRNMAAVPPKALARAHELGRRLVPKG